MPEQDDAGVGLFFIGEDAVVITVEQAENGVKSGLAVPILENLNVRIFGKGTLDALGKLNGPVMKVVVAHEAADESDDDRGRSRFAKADWAISRASQRSKHCESRNEEGKKAISRRDGHEGS